VKVVAKLLLAQETAQVAAPPFSIAPLARLELVPIQSVFVQMEALPQPVPQEEQVDQQQVLMVLPF
jgi:hypothetical protein